MSVKRGRGRPPYEPSAEHRRLVNGMVGCGFSVAQIGAILGITPPTVRRHFRAEISTGAIEANASVAGNIFKVANNPDHPAFRTCALFWMKVHAGWRDGSEPSGTQQGKKDLASDVARQAGKTGRFATPPGPRLAVNNAG